MFMITDLFSPDTQGQSRSSRFCWFTASDEEYLVKENFKSTPNVS